MFLSKWRTWAWPRELRRRGILGINRRNARYVLTGNPRRLYPRVDDKLFTKRICEGRGIPVPQTYLTIRRHGDVRKFLDLTREQEQFVIKPARGSEGRGIIVVAKRDGATFETAGGEKLVLADVQYHLGAILSGLYSLAGQPDAAIVEQRIVPHPLFAPIAVGGTPDVRVVLYRCVPVMAMVRLPTRASRGRANLHQGAVAAAIHLGTGLTFGGVCRNREVSVHPDTGASIEGLLIPWWNKLLAAAADLAGALEWAYSIRNINCWKVSKPWPPYSLGQLMPAQPPAYSVFCQARSKARPSAPSDGRACTGLLDSSQSRTCSRNCICCGVKSRFIAQYSRQSGARSASSFFK